MARKPRVCLVECEKASGWRWLKRSVRGAVLLPDDSFSVTDESQWQQCLQAAGGREISP